MLTATYYIHREDIMLSVFYTLSLGILIKLYDIFLYSKKIRLGKPCNLPTVIQIQVCLTLRSLLVLYYGIYLASKNLATLFKDLKHLWTGKEYRRLACHP